MRPASRSRSVLSVRICAARICVSDCNWVIREGIRAIADDSLVANIWRSRSLAISVWLVIARAARAIAVTHPQPHNQRSELSSRTRLRGLREPGSGGVSSSAHGPLDGRIIENVSRIRRFPLSSRGVSEQAGWPFAYGPGGLLGVLRNLGRAEPGPDVRSKMSRDRARGRRRHPHAIACAKGAA